MEKYPTLPTRSYRDIRQSICSGDILLCSGQSIFSLLIQKATTSVWSHVAFVLRVEAINRIMVLESVESIGVRAVPLSAYVRNYNGTGQGYLGRLLIARHDQVKQENIIKLSQQAVDLLGYPYRQEEILHIAMRLSKHSLGLPDEKPDNLTQRAFICSEYAQTCFNSIGAHIDYNPIGFISPDDFVRSPNVKPLFYLQPEYHHEEVPTLFKHAAS